MTEPLASSELDRGLLLEKRLRAALRAARGGNTALVIVPDAGYTRAVLNFLAGQIHAVTETHARFTPSELHFQGTRGSVRIYPATHVTYDAQRQRLSDYPPTTQTFLHPDLEQT